MIAATALIICVLSYVQAQSLQSLDGASVAVLERQFSQADPPTNVQLTVRDVQQAYLNLTGFGEVTVQIEALSRRINRNVTCSVYIDRVCMLWNFEDQLFQPKEPVALTIYTKMRDRGPDSRVKFVLMGGKYLLLRSREDVLIETSSVQSLNLVFSLEDMTTTVPREDSKIQVFIKQFYSSLLDSNQYIKMYLAAGTKRLTAFDAQYQATSTIGVGNVVTLLPSDEHYCYDPTCTYSLRVDTMNVRLMEVQMVVFDRKTTVRIDEGVILIDQLRDADNATYLFESADDGSKFNWRFDMYAVEGNADVFIHGDALPATLDAFQWSSAQAGNENIFITSKAIQDSKLTGKLFYVFVQSEKQATFWMSVFKRRPSDVEQVLPNTPVTGEAGNGDLVNYRFFPDVTIPEKLSIFVTLVPLSGNPDLYFKDCADREICLVSQSDVDQPGSVAGLFRYSLHPTDEDSINVELTCIPRDEKFKGFVFDSPLDRLHASKHCRFAIGVVGRETALSSVSRYRLEVRGARFHKSVRLKEVTRLRIDQHQTNYYSFDVDKADLAGRRFLTVKLIVLSGDVEVYASRTFPYPDDQHYDKFVAVDNDNAQLFTTTKLLTFEGDPDALRGRYYLSISASQFVFGSILVQSTASDEEAANLANDVEVRPGTSIYSTIKALDGEQRRYFFAVDMPADRDELEFIVQVMPLQGNVRFCVSAEHSHVENWEQCTWTDHDNFNIIVSHRDPRFKRKFKYGILVVPVLDEFADRGKDYSYSLSLSSQDTIMELAEGVVSRMWMLSTAKYFKIRASPTSNETVVMLTSMDFKASLETTTNRSDLYESTKVASKMRRTSHGAYASILYKMRELESECDAQDLRTDGVEPVCYIYIKVTPSVQQANEFSLLVFADDKPTYLQDGGTTTVPAPLASEVLLRYTPTSTKKSVTLNVYSEYYGLKVVAGLYSSTTDPLKHHQTYVASDIGTNVIHIPEAHLQQVVSPYITVRLQNADYRKSPSDFAQAGAVDALRDVSVQLSRGLKRLSHMVPIEEDRGKKGFFQYFKFSKPRDADGLLLLQVLTGEADLYVKRGGDVYPDLNTFDFRSNTIKNDELLLPKASPQPGADPLETFVVGVYSREASSFKILASKNASFVYLPVGPGELVTRELTPEKPLVLSYYNSLGGRFVFGFYGATAQVEAVYRAYDETTSLSFFDELPTDQHLSLGKKIGFFNRFEVQPLLGDTKNRQYLFRLSTNVSSTVNFFVGPPEVQLSVRGGEAFGDLVEAGRCNNYSVSYDSAVVDEQVMLKVESGDVNLTVSHADLLPASLSKSRLAAPASFGFKIIEIFAGKDLGEDSFPIFKDAVVSVCGNQPSSFVVTTSKPSLTLNRLFPNTRFAVAANNSQQLFYYKTHADSVKSLRLKVDLQPTSNSAKLTDVREVFDLIEVFYVTSSEDFGYIESGMQDVLKQLSVPATTLEEKLVDERGHKFATVAFSVLNGVFVVRIKPGLPRSPKLVQLQLIVNEFKLLSTMGSNLDGFAPGKQMVYQVIKPSDAILDLAVSSCAGKFDVKVFDGDQQMKLLHAFSVGRAYEANNLSQIIAELNRPVTVRHRIDSQLVFIEVTNALAVESFLNIQTDVAFRNDSTSIFDYFQAYQPSRSHQPAPFYKFAARKDSYDVQLVHLQPSANYQNKLRQFNKVMVEHILVSSSTPISQYFSDSTCSLHHLPTASDERTSIFIHTAEYDIRDGSIDYNSELVRLTDLKYPRGELPFSNMIQIRLVFKGPFDDGSEDDAVVLLKDFYQVTSVESELLRDSGWVTAVCLLLVLCLAVALYRLHLRCKKLAAVSAPPQAYEQSASTDQSATELPDASADTQTGNKLEVSSDTI